MYYAYAQGKTVWKWVSVCVCIYISAWRKVGKNPKPIAVVTSEECRLGVGMKSLRAGKRTSTCYSIYYEIK